MEEHLLQVLIYIMQVILIIQVLLTMGKMVYPKVAYLLMLMLGLIL